MKGQKIHSYDLTETVVTALYWNGQERYVEHTISIDNLKDWCKSNIDLSEYQYTDDVDMGESEFVREKFIDWDSFFFDSLTKVDVDKAVTYFRKVNVLAYLAKKVGANRIFKQLQNIK